MRYRKLDSSGDFMTGHGAADFHIDTAEAVAQSVVTRLKLWAGEWFEDTEEGTPYRQKVLGEFKLRTAGAAIKRRIVQTNGVSAVRDFSATYDAETRQLSVSATIETIYGETSIEEVL
ncbi:MAG: hypothetical protein IJ233_11705 [Pyramidobacter sp.]|nr:hypothetical protein [Pyramidobacter sp.]